MIEHSTKDLEIEQVPQFVENPTPTILEIGCNDGTDTNRLLAKFPEGRVYGFEPDPRAIERYKTTVDDPRAVLTEAAVSDSNGIAKFHGSSGRAPERSRHPGASHYCYLDEWDLSGSLCKPTGHLTYSPWTTFPEDREYAVETLKLDTWLAQHPEITGIDFTWCDVQGAEARVIRGATEALKIIKYFYTEFYDPPLYEGQLPLEDLAKLLPGFDLLAIYGCNALFKNREL